MQTIPPVSEEVLESIRINQEWIQKLAPIAEEVMSAQKELNAIMEQLQPALAEYQCAFNEIAQLLAEVSIPSVSEEEKEKLLKSHRQWGEYGWTLHPNAILKFSIKNRLIAQMRITGCRYFSRKTTQTVFSDRSSETCHNQKTWSRLFFAFRIKSIRLVLYSYLVCLIQC